MNEAKIVIKSDSDILAARQKGREMAKEIGFEASDLALITTAISEIARNIVRYAISGEMVFSVISERNRKGILVVATDRGPGIPNLELAMRDGYSTHQNSLGLGLPGSKRMMDDFDIRSEIGSGTVVTMKKWIQVY